MCPLQDKSVPFTTDFAGKRWRSRSWSSGRTVARLSWSSTGECQCSADLFHTNNAMSNIFSRQRETENVINLRAKKETIGTELETMVSFCSVSFRRLLNSVFLENQSWWFDEEHRRHEDWSHGGQNVHRRHENIPGHQDGRTQCLENSTEGAEPETSPSHSGASQDRIQEQS